MTNTQYTEILAELRAMRAVLERSAALAESLANPAQALDPAEYIVPAAIAEAFEAEAAHVRKHGAREVAFTGSPGRVHVNGTTGGGKKARRK
jgi:hypothetical protein